MERCGLRGLRAAVCLTVATILLVTSCRFDVALQRDDRIDITTPGDRDDVSLPVTVQWAFEDLGHDVTFVVLVDEPAPPPGKGLEWYGRNDPVCRRRPQCPDDRYLAARGIHVADGTSLTIETMVKPSTPHERELHDLTVVALDGNGERIGEAGDTITIEVVR